MQQDPYMQQPIYESQPVSPNEIYANEMQSERIRNILSQTSPDNQLSDIEYRIKGYRKNNFTGEWEEIDGSNKKIHPMLVSRFISFLSSILNDNTRFTNLSSMQINRIMALCIDYLSDDLDTHSVDYGLEDDYTERTRIGLIILNSTFFVLKRAENGMESRRIWNTMTLNENNNFMPQQKKSFLDNLKFWKQ